MSTLRKDYEFIYKTIKHKDNKIIHYPAIKNLIFIFEKKWKFRRGNNLYMKYANLLKATLKKSFK